MLPLSLRVSRSQFIVKSYSMGFKGVISINTRIRSLRDSLPHNGYNQFQPLENGYNQFQPLENLTMGIFSSNPLKI